MRQMKNWRGTLNHSTFLILGGFKMFTTSRRSALLGAIAAIALSTAALAQDLKPLNSDIEPDRMGWSELEAKFGPAPTLKR